ncbi:MAG TPA: hypothetical protein VN327_04870 [Pseudonocardiaceae bacterium]|nr:hypothetical protein [Pseudonocardiaceae bacterium]
MVLDHRGGASPADQRRAVERVENGVAAVSARMLTRLPAAFILTNLDVSTPDKAAVVEHRYRHRVTAKP